MIQLLAMQIHAMKQIDRLVSGAVTDERTNDRPEKTDHKVYEERGESK